MNSKNDNLVYLIFSNLKDKWSFERSLKETDTEKAIGRVTGQACFTETSPEELQYEEKGLFTFHEKQYEVTRSYEYRLIKNENKEEIIQVLFSGADPASGLLFHIIQLTEKPTQEKNIQLLTAKDSHLCKEDQYNVEYEFLLKENKLIEFNIRYKVKGPEKNYTSTTHFER